MINEFNVPNCIELLCNLVIFFIHSVNDYTGRPTLYEKINMRHFKYTLALPYTDASTFDDKSYEDSQIR